jgi:type IV pilus assembly protein PilB
MGTVIDLPVSPLRSTTAEGSLRNAPVIASLMDGKTLAGRLVSVDGPQRLIVLHRKGLGRTYQIRFSQLRALHFVARYPINRGRHPLQEQSAQTFMPRASQEFRIVFNDQKVLTGRTRGSFVDEVGIHLFQMVDDSHISRLFIPAQVVRRYYIGQRKPKDLHQQPSAAAEGAAPDKAAPAPRRRKSDRRPRKPMAASAAQLEQALETQSEPGSLTGDKRIGAMLVEEGIVTAEQLEAALRMQEREPASKIGEILVRMGTVAADEIYAALAHKFGMPFVLLRDFFVDIECLKLVPADVARKYTLVPLLVHKDHLVVAMDDPANTEAITLLRFMTQYRIEPTIATRADVQWAIGKYYGFADEADTRPRDAPKVAAAEPPDGEHLVMDKAVTSFIDNTILDAIGRDASDIHIVSQPNYAEMLFRIKGALVPIRRFNRVLTPGVMARLRTMARLRGPSGGRPQSGQACMLSGDDVIGLHITIAPGEAGDQAVIRVLDSMLQLKRVRDLDFSPGDAQRLTEMLNKTYSLLVVSGPRGSGKSRTLYAALRTLQEMRLEIATVEAPIKFFVDGLNQWQAGEGDEDFKRVLEEARASAPDVLMIGMLDGPRRLRLAMEAALGGCLVLSKLHAAGAAAAVSDMMAMDSAHRLLNSTLTGVLAQQLVKLNCKFCMREEETAAGVRQDLGVSADEVFYAGRGCEHCNHSGHSGDFPVFELLSVTPEMHELIHAGAPAGAILRQAIADGMVPAAESGLMLARTRRISLAEAHRLWQRTRID